MQRYYVQYLSGYDAIVLNQQIQNLNVIPEDESVIFSSFYNTIAGLSVKQVEGNELFDFRGLRLDWFRMQVSVFDLFRLIINRTLSLTLWLINPCDAKFILEI